MEYKDNFEASSKYSSTCYDDWSERYYCTDLYYYESRELLDKALESIKAYSAKLYNYADVRVIENPIDTDYPWAVAVETYMEA